MSVISAGYVGVVVKGDAVDVVFNTVDTATDTPTGAFTGVGGTGLPTFRYMNATSKITGTSGLSAPVINIGGLQGLHAISLDTTNLDINADYSIQIVAGEVDGVSVTDMVVANFNCSGRASGRVYEQVVKCDSGSVANSAGETRTFQITGIDIEDATDNYYRTQVLKFSPGSANKNIGRTILSSSPLGSNTCSITVQDAFPKPLVNGDPVVILPEERELTIYTANITAEWGGSDQTPRDQYTVWWSANGQLIMNPDNVITNMAFVVFRRNYPGIDTLIINQPLTSDLNSGAYEWDETTSFISQSQGALMVATATIDGVNHSFQRVLYNYV